MKILIVDDQPVCRLSTRLQLKDLGGAFGEASNGVEALKMLSAEDFSLILMDCQMPVMNGFQCTEEIRARGIEAGENMPRLALAKDAKASGRRRIPIIGYTGYDDSATARRALEAGMDACLSKLVETEDLIAAVTNWLRAV